MDFVEMVYPMDPDEFNRTFIDVEVQAIVNQIAEHPAIYIDDVVLDFLNLSGVDIAIPVGAVNKVGILGENSPLKNAIVMQVVFQDTILEAIKKLDNLQYIKLKVRPYIIGEVHKIEDKLFIDNSELANLKLVLGEK